MTQPRKPKGTPTGGQFAGKAHAEATQALAASEAPSLTKIDNGRFRVFDARTQTDDTFVRITVGGINHRRAESAMVAARMKRSDDIQAAMRYFTDKGGKGTFLLRHQDGDIEVIEGTMISQPDGPILKKKGSSTRGYPVDGMKIAGMDVIGVEKGYGGGERLAAHYQQMASECPNLEKATFDDLPTWDANETDEPPSDIAAVYVFTHPGFDESQDGSGCVFFATDHEDGIVNGYLVAPGDSGLFSENGSFTEAQLAQWGGRAAGYRSGFHTFSDAIDFGDQASAYGENDIELCWDAVRGAST